MKHLILLLALLAPLAAQTLTNTTLDGVTNATLNGVLDNDAAATRTALGLGTAATEAIRSLNAKSYGATGDGIADDTTPLQNLLNAAATQMRSAFIPLGTYRITAALTIPNSGGAGDSGFLVSGEGMNATIIVQETVNVHGISRFSHMNGLRIENMTIRLPDKATTTGNCLDLDGDSTGLNQCVIRNVETQLGNVGMRLDVWNNSLVQSCRMGRSGYESNVGLEFDGNSNASHCSALSIMGSTTGILFGNLGSVKFDGLDMGGGGQIYPIDFDSTFVGSVALESANIEWQPVTNSKDNVMIDLRGANAKMTISNSNLRASSGGGYVVGIQNSNTVTFINTTPSNTFTKGLQTTAVATAATDVITTGVTHYLQRQQGVVFTSSGTLPAGLVAGTTYYIKTVPSATTMTLAPTTALSTTIDITDTGSGTHTITGSGAAVRNDEQGTVVAYPQTSSAWVDYFTAGVFNGRRNITTYATAQNTASESERGRMYMTQMPSSNTNYDKLEIAARSTDHTFNWVNLLDYWETRKTYGDTPPAFQGYGNIFTGVNTIRSAFPRFRLETTTATQDYDRAIIGISNTTAGQATGDVNGDTVISAKSTGNLVLATGPATTKQIVRLSIKPAGNLNLTSAAVPNYADDAAADAALASGDIYTTTAGGRTVYRKP